MSTLANTPTVRSWRTTKWTTAGALILLALCVLLPGQRSIPTIDRDEARFAQASRQMLESGTLEGWMIPRVGEKTRLNKPPLIYWAQASVAGIATGFDANNDAIWMYRLPSLLAAIGTVLLTWRLGVAMFGGTGLRSVGALAGAFMAVSPLMAFDAHMARSDELLVFLTTASMVMLFDCWRRDRRGQSLAWWRTTALWLLVGLGTLTKGPLCPMVVVTTAIALTLWTRQWRFLFKSIRPLSGVVLVAAVFVPWVLLAAKAVGFETLWTIAWDEVVVRSSSGRESHGAPPGYHLVLLVVLLWPGTLLSGIAIARGVRRARGHSTKRTLARGRSGELFCVAWLIPAWIIFELAATKLPHYPLPLYPAIALLSARAVFAGARALPQVKKTSARIGFLLWFVLGCAIVSLPIGLLALVSTQGELAELSFASRAALAVGGIAGLALLVWSLRWTWQGRIAEAQWLAIPAAAIALGLTFGVSLPAATPIWNTPRIAQVLDENDLIASDIPIAAAGYHEDSLMFATRGRLERIGLDQIASWCAAHPDGTLIAPSTEDPPTPSAQKLGSVEGYNYSNGKPVSLSIWHLRSGPTQ